MPLRMALGGIFLWRCKGVSAIKSEMRRADKTHEGPDSDASGMGFLEIEVLVVMMALVLQTVVESVLMAPSGFLTQYGQSLLNMMGVGAALFGGLILVSLWMDKRVHLGSFALIIAVCGVLVFHYVLYGHWWPF